MVKRQPVSISALTNSPLHQSAKDTAIFSFPGLDDPGSLESLPTLSRGSAENIHRRKTQDEISSEIQNEINLRILESKQSEHRNLPRWLRYYRGVSYFFYLIITLYSLGYLGTIGYFQANYRMSIQYTDIVQYLELNSYSLLSPILCPIFMWVLAYHLRKNVRLDEGDFFGLLGIILLCSLVSFHDAFGMWRLGHSEKDNDKTTPPWDPPKENLKSVDDLQWQYAWSTSRKCAKLYVRELVYQHEYDRFHVQKELIVEYAPAQERSLAAHAAEATYEEDCDGYHAKKENAELRKWMIDFQNEEKCCGPYGWLDWELRFASKEGHKCNEGWRPNEKGEYDHSLTDIPGCYEPLMKWLEEVCMVTFWIMIAQGILYIVSGVLAVIHHTAMKLEEERIVKQYSLLDLTEKKETEEDLWLRATRPLDQPVISGSYDAKRLAAEAAEEAEPKDKRKKRLKGISRKLVTINSTISMTSAAAHLHHPGKNYSHMSDRRQTDVQSDVIRRIQRHKSKKQNKSENTEQDTEIVNPT